MWWDLRLVDFLNFKAADLALIVTFKSGGGLALDGLDTGSTLSQLLFGSCVLNFQDLINRDEFYAISLQLGTVLTKIANI